MFHTSSSRVLCSAPQTGVVIPWRGFRCFTLGRSDCRPPGAMEVVIPWRGFRCFTRNRRRGLGRRKRAGVVIPWPGFRCFTLQFFGEELGIWTVVVIPWRGFRCFTLTTHERRPEIATIQVWVVIPWRGFRCFTLAVMEASKSLPEAEKL